MSRYCASVEMQPTPLGQFDRHATNLGLSRYMSDVDRLRDDLIAGRTSRNEALATLNLVAADLRGQS